MIDPRARRQRSRDPRATTAPARTPDDTRRRRRTAAPVRHAGDRSEDVLVDARGAATTTCAPPSNVSAGERTAATSARQVMSCPPPLPSSVPATLVFLNWFAATATRCVRTNDGDAVNRQARLASSAAFLPSFVSFTSSGRRSGRGGSVRRSGSARADDGATGRRPASTGRP